MKTETSAIFSFVLAVSIVVMLAVAALYQWTVPDPPAATEETPVVYLQALAG